MSNLSFSQPIVLAALVLVPLVAIAWAFFNIRARRRARAISRVPGRGPAYVAAVLCSLAGAAAIAAAAGPRWGTEERSVPRSGSDLVVVLDVSRSMDATDAAPTRLDAARQAIAATLEQLGGDRVGLVIFAGDAIVRFPLTTDIPAALRVVQTIETGSILVQGGSNIGAGLNLALDLFDPETQGGRLVLLLSDGENLSDPAGVASAAARFPALDADLFVVGYGTPQGSTVPVYDLRTREFQPKLDDNGQPIISRLDEATLTLVASAAEGRYLGSNPAGVAGAVAGRLASLEQVQFDEERTEVPIERFQWFAGVALALLALGAIAERLPELRRSRRAATLGAVAVALALFAGCATAAHDANDRGLRAFKLGDYPAAEAHFLEARAEQPENPTVTLNLAATLHASGRFDDAARVARFLLSSTDPGVQADGYASLGHHLFAAGDLAGALEAFHQALRRAPGDDASRHDYEVVLRLLQPPPDGDPDDPGDGDPDPSATPPTGTQQPGNGGQPTPNPGATPEPGSTPGPSDPGDDGGRPSGADIDAQIDALDRQIAQLLTEAGPEPSALEAIQILELLAERARIAAQRDALRGGGDPLDY
ncbi:MAG: VWA domain-containing protein [Dehalococcoidia bacterium]